MCFIIVVYVHMNYIKGLCICIWNHYIPGYNIKNVYLSIEIGRSSYPSTWPVDNKPWLVYATLPENAINSIFINFHINLDSCANQQCEPRFEYSQLVGHETDQAWSLADLVKGEYESPLSEYSTRHIFTVLLSSLEPNTTYIFKITEKLWDNNSFKSYSYKTFDMYIL